MSWNSSDHRIHHACVVYDAATGEIRHVHQVVVLPGAEAPAKQDFEARAIALAEQFGKHDPLHLKVLHVAPESLEPRMRYKVDLKSLTLISQPTSRRDLRAEALLPY